MYNKLEQFKLEENIGILKYAGKFRKYEKTIVPLWIFGPISIVTMKQNTQWCGLGYKHFWGGGHYLGGGGGNGATIKCDEQSVSASAI